MQQTELRTLAQTARAWPFEEARKLLDRLGGKIPAKGYVLFETGYGPSGLPHIGTFGEVVRTSMVRRAFQALSDIPTRMFCFSDDMDGLRKVPDNVPNKEMLQSHLGKSLTAIPDPFGTHDSFGAHNNARLRAFLDGFGFEYEFLSSTECYRAGRFDKALRTALEVFDAIQAVMLPTLGEERRETYSPFMPISPVSGRVLQVPLTHRDAKAGTIRFVDEDGVEKELPVTGGNCKLQWKPDWAMRWVALDVDYEMSGKDLIDSVKASARIAEALGGRAPVGFTYEMFLDEGGQKISKSKGNGLSIEEWLTYGTPESLALFMYHQPKSAKKLFFGVIPKSVDEHLTFVEKFPGQEPAQQLDNPAWHIHAGKPPQPDSDLSFGMLMNLASVANADDPARLWGYIAAYKPGLSPQTAPVLDRLVGHAVRYYQDFIKPKKVFRLATDEEAAALQDLLDTLAKFDAAAEAEAIQFEVYEVGKRHFAKERLREWFGVLYAVLLGQTEGPRMGTFIKLYGLSAMQQLIQDALAGKLAQAAA